MELVFVLTLREFEDPTGNEEETKADTDDEDPPFDSYPEKYNGNCRAET